MQNNFCFYEKIYKKRVYQNDGTEKPSHFIVIHSY